MKRIDEKKYNYANPDLNITMKILDISKDTEGIYRYLENLELEGKKDSEEYELVASLIKDQVKKEYAEFRKINNLFEENFQDVRGLIEALGRTTDEDILNVLNTNATNSRIKRFYAHARDISLVRYEKEPLTKMKKDNDDTVPMNFGGLTTDVPKILARIFGIDPEAIEKEKEKKEDETRRISCDLIYYKYALINSLFYDYLVDYIENCKNKNIKKRLIKYKYQLIFTTPTLENAFANTPKSASRTEIYKERIEENVEKYRLRYHDDYLIRIYDEVENSINNLAQAQFDKKSATIGEKVDNILQILYTKACISAIYDESFLESLQTTTARALLEDGTKDDEENVNEVFRIDEKLRMPILRRKNVD